MNEIAPSSRPPVRLTIEQTMTMAETHLNDLQAEVESEHRTLEQLRKAILSEQIRQADRAGRLAMYIHEISGSVAEQLERLRELRGEIRHARDLIRKGTAEASRNRSD